MSQDELARVAAELSALERARTTGALDRAGEERRRLGIEELLRLLALGAEAERRQHVRIPADLEVGLQIDQIRAACAAAELSQGGLGLRGELWVEEGATVLVENLRVGARDFPMSARARVVWKSAEAAGLSFLDVDARNERQIRSVFEELFWLYVDRLASR